MRRLNTKRADDLTASKMTLDSLREPSLIQLEQYFSSNPYREYSMQKPYFPKTFYSAAQTHRSLGSQNPSLLAYQELLDPQKDPISLDRIAYKLRMKSDLNIETLREPHVRRRHRRPRPQYQNPSGNHDAMSSIPPSMSTKSAFPRQPTSITVSTNTMKNLINDDLNGIEGSAVRVGTLDDLIKQFRRAEFRLVRRAPEYLDNASTQMSSEISPQERTGLTKTHYHQERPVKQPQALTEYRFNAPTFPTTPTQNYREPTIHQGLIYQYRNRERTMNQDLPILPNRPILTSEQPRQRTNSLVIEERPPTAIQSKDRRIQESREKSLMRTEKQICVCSKLNIVDPFNSSFEQSDSNLPQIHSTPHSHQQQQTPSVNYLFPPVRPFGYFTKKSASTTDDNQTYSLTPPPVPRRRKRHTGKKKQDKLSNHSTGSLDKLVQDETFDEDDSQVLNETLQSMLSLNDPEEMTQNNTADIQANLNETFNTTCDKVDEF